MNGKKFFTLLIACMFSIVCLATPAVAAASYDPDVQIITRATDRIETAISANTIVALGESVSLDKGESVTFKLTYTPKSASVDFGLIDSQNHFHYFNITSGSINKSVRISEAGSYILAIRNNSGSTVTVTGTVNY